MHFSSAHGISVSSYAAISKRFTFTSVFLFSLLGILQSVLCAPGQTYGIKIHVYPKNTRIDVVCGSAGYKPYYYKIFYKNGTLEWKFKATESDEGWYCQAQNHIGCLKKWHQMQVPRETPSLPWCEPFLVYGKWYLKPNPFNSTIGESIPKENNEWVIDKVGKRRIGNGNDNFGHADFDEKWDFEIYRPPPTVKPPKVQMDKPWDTEFFETVRRIGNGDENVVDTDFAEKWDYKMHRPPLTVKPPKVQMDNPLDTDFSKLP